MVVKYVVFFYQSVILDKKIVWQNFCASARVILIADTEWRLAQLFYLIKSIPLNHSGRNTEHAYWILLTMLHVTSNQTCVSCMQIFSSLLNSSLISISNRNRNIPHVCNNYAGTELRAFIYIHNVLIPRIDLKYFFSPDNIRKVVLTSS